VIYPNPTDDFVNIRTLDKKTTKIVVTDIIGNLVFENKISESNEPTQISLKAVPDGVYFVTLFEKNKGITTKKVILHNKK